MPPSGADRADKNIHAPICATFPDRENHATTSLGTDYYYAVVDCPVLPGSQDDEAAFSCRGAAVDLGDKWVFFDDLASAAGFVRAGRNSNLLLAWDLFEAAELRTFCPEHHQDELALLLGRQIHDEAEVQWLVRTFANADRARAQGRRFLESSRKAADVTRFDPEHAGGLFRATGCP